MGYIYRITNKVNGKVYVGQTTKEVRERWYRHKDPKSQCPKLRKAIQKYGAENFALDIICVCFNDDLSRFEKEYIKKYDSLANGYNCTPGGEGVVVWTDEMRKAMSAKLTGRKLSPEHAAKLRGVNAPMYGRKHTEEARALMRQNSKIKKLEVDQYTLDGKFVKRFDSMTAAAAAINVNKSTIMCACDRVNGATQGFMWKWAAERKPPVMKPGDKRALNLSRKPLTDEHKRLLRLKSNWNGRKVDQFTLDGKFVKRFDCLRDAADSVNAHTKSVRTVCDGAGKHAKGYWWRWVEPPAADVQAKA